MRKNRKIIPIHKYNNGNGATLCHVCSKIISTGFTKDLFCEKHLIEYKKANGNTLDTR